MVVTGRVALVPEIAARLAGTGLKMLVEAGAGAAATFADDAYTEADASIVDATELYESAASGQVPMDRPAGE